MARKYEITRQDGSHPIWPYFVLGGPDEAAAHALRAYAMKAEQLGYSREYTEKVWELADEFDSFRVKNGSSKPDDTLLELGPIRVENEIKI